MVKEFRSRATAAGARNVARKPAATGFRAHATRRRATRMAHSSTKVQQLESEFLFRVNRLLLKIYLILEMICREFRLRFSLQEAV